MQGWTIISFFCKNYLILAFNLAKDIQSVFERQLFQKIGFVMASADSAKFGNRVPYL